MPPELPMIRSRASLAIVAGILLITVAGCSRKAQLGTAAKLTEVSTGWYDAGVTEDGKNKLVPSITFRIRNTAQDPLGSTQLNLIFKRVIDQDEWTTSFVRGIGPEGLAAGATTPPIVIRAQQGYTGTQSRVTMLQNAQFIDFKVEVFGKHGSGGWVKLAEFPIERQLLTK
jgi:hypothetical protein